MRSKPKRSLPPRGAARAVPSGPSQGKRSVRQADEYSDEIFRSLIQDFQIGVVVFDASARIEFANTAALKMFGLASDTTLGKTTEELGVVSLREDGSEIPSSMRARDRAIQSGKPVRGEVIGIRRAGVDDVVWVYGNVTPRFDPDGSFRRLIVTLTDVTDRMKARQELERTNEFNREILASAQEGIIAHGLDLRYQVWNPFMEQMSGLKAKDVLGKHPCELFPFLQEYGGLAAMERALAGQVATEINMPYEVPQTGEKGWCDNKYAPLRNESGDIVGVIATVRDVTDRKQREDELHDLSSRLLQLQDEERRRIARDLHDGLAQHLTAAALNLAQLSKLPARTKRADVLSETRKIIAECARHVRSLSYLLHPPLLDELGLISAIEEYAEGFSRRTAIRLDLDLEPNVGRLSREIETALFRILQEGLGNIQKHSGSSSGSIRLAREADEISLKIADAGKGIPGSELHTHATGALTLGVGILGMRERMRQLGGRLEISSNGRGTTVRAVVLLKNGASNVRSHSHRR